MKCGAHDAQILLFLMGSIGSVSAVPEEYMNSKEKGYGKAKFLKILGQRNGQGEALLIR